MFMKIEIHKVSKKLKNLREEKNLTQEELAKTLGVSRQSIISLEQGKCLPSLPLAVSFAEIFEMPFERLFCESINNMREEVNQIMANDITPWSPMREASHLHDAIDRLFEDNATGSQTLQIPQVNILNKDKNIVVTADMPGINEDDISIEVGDESITISGERKVDGEDKEKDFYRREVSYGSFTRTMSLPSVVDKDKAEAELKNGTLRVLIPKKAEMTPKVTKLKIKKG